MTLAKILRCAGPCPRESYGGFAPKPKPIFPVLGPQDREYSTINLKPKLTLFMAFLEFCSHGVALGFGFTS
jgi:hypothetical protein